MHFVFSLLSLYNAFAPCNRIHTIMTYILSFVWLASNEKQKINALCHIRHNNSIPISLRIDVNNSDDKNIEKRKNRQAKNVLHCKCSKSCAVTPSEYKSTLSAFIAVLCMQFIAHVAHEPNDIFI